MRSALLILLVLISSSSFVEASGSSRESFRDRIRDRIAARRGDGAGDAGPLAKRENIETGTLGGVSVAIWRPKEAGPAPLVIFSHGLHGMAAQSTFLTQVLADHGYLVVAPNHADSARGMLSGASSMRPQVPIGQVESWTDETYRDRRDDVVHVVEALKTDPAWKGKIDWSRFALAGHSMGGYTALGLAGAWPSWKLPGVRAVLGHSPYAAAFVKQKTMGGVHVPVMYMSGTRDLGILPSVSRPGGLYDQSTSPAYLIVFQGAGHFAFSDFPSDCHDDIAAASLAFLDRYVKGDLSADPARRLPHMLEVKSK